MLDVPPGSDAPLSCLLLGGEHALSFPGPGPFFFPPAHPFSFPTHPGFFPSPRIHPLVQQKPSSAPIHAVPPSLLYLSTRLLTDLLPLFHLLEDTQDQEKRTLLSVHTPPSSIHQTSSLNKYFPSRNLHFSNTHSLSCFFHCCCLKNTALFNTANPPAPPAPTTLQIAHSPLGRHPMH